MLSAARRPMILADVEIHRFGLQDDLLALAEETGMPIATTILGKSVIPEGHPLFVGVYEGGMGREEVTRYVEEAEANPRDALILKHLTALCRDLSVKTIAERVETDGTAALLEGLLRG